MALLNKERGRKLLASGQESDFQIKLADGTIERVHKAILLATSDYFETAISKDFQERTTGVLDLSDHDSETIRRMIKYIYGVRGTAELCGLTASDEDWLASLRSIPSAQLQELAMSLVRLYIAADYFGVEGLDEDAKHNVNHLFRHHKSLQDAHLAAALEFVFENVQDQEYREDVLRSCIEAGRYGDGTAFPKVLEVMEKHEAAAWEVGKHYWGLNVMLNERIEELEAGSP